MTLRWLSAIVASRRSAFGGTGSVPDQEAIRTELSGLEALSEQSAHDLVGEKLHPAVGVVDDEPLPRPEELDEMTSERIASSLARPPALRITWASPSEKPA